MSTNNHHLTGGPAYPSQFYNDSDRNLSAPDGQIVAPGDSVQMIGATLRDLLASSALQGLAANPNIKMTVPHRVEFAYQLADEAMRHRLKIGIQPQADVDGDAQKVAPGQADTKPMEIQVLHKVASTLGLTAGSDVVRDTLPALHALIEGKYKLAKAAAELKRDRDHLHSRLGELQRTSSADAAPDTKLGADLDPAQLLRDMVREAGIGDYIVVLDRNDDIRGIVKRLLEKGGK